MINISKQDKTYNRIKSLVVRLIFIILTVVVIVVLSSSTVKAQTQTTNLVETGYFQYDYFYNIVTNDKDLNSMSIYLSDTTVMMKTSTDFYFYNITNVIQSNTDVYQVMTTDVNGEEYKLTITKGVVYEERVSNSSGWYFVAKGFVPAFENMKKI